MADFTGTPSDPGFEGKTHFLGTLSSAGFVGTPNAAPREWEHFDPLGAGEKTDTGYPVGQANVGFHGVAGGHGGSAGGDDGYDGKESGSISGSDSGSAGMPPFTS